jgi:hypothetical protein
MLIKFHVYCKFDVPGHVVPIRMNDDLRNLHNKRLHQDINTLHALLSMGSMVPFLGNRSKVLYLKMKMLRLLLQSPQIVGAEPRRRVFRVQTTLW